MSAVLEQAVATCARHGQYHRRMLYGRWTGWCGECEKTLAAEEQGRMRAVHIEELLTRANLPPRFARKGFTDYHASTPGQVKALQACQRYIEELEQRLGNGSCLVLIGPPGVGKTHLLSAVAAEACQAEVRTQYTTATSFLAAIKGSFEWNAAGADEFIRVPILVLDDVWTPPSGREAGALLALLDERYRRCLPTLVASNLSWPQMQTEVGARFCDRLLEAGGQVIAVDGKSARSGGGQ